MLHVAPSNTETLPVSQTVTKDGDIVISYNDDTGDEQEGSVTLEFVEEPCGVTAKQGFGYLQVEFGDRIGPENRYEILRKLGWGMQASVWLAKDTLQDRFVAVKALNGHTTGLVKDGVIRELDILRKVSSCGGGMQETHCLSLLDDFIQPGKDEADGEHLCLVTDPLGPSVGVFRRTIKRFTKPLVKRMFLHVLKGLDHLHSLGIAHTDLRPENIMMDFQASPNSFDIAAFIRDNPAKRHPQERTWGDKFVRVAVSQPFPIPSFEDWLSQSFVIADFGSAQFLDRQVTDTISPLDLRPPESFLGLPWNEKVDIWTFGCLVFEFINNQKLFKTASLDLPSDLAMVWQILLHTRDRLSAETIRSSPIAMEYLDPETGWLAIDFPRPDIDIYRVLEQIGSLTKPEDLEGVTALLRKCLRLDPKDRSSAKELLQDPWLNTET